jgi:hypothetical protein
MLDVASARASANPNRRVAVACLMLIVLAMVLGHATRGAGGRWELLDAALRQARG